MYIRVETAVQTLPDSVSDDGILWSIFPIHSHISYEKVLWDGCANTHFYRIFCSQKMQLDYLLNNIEESLSGRRFKILHR